MSLRDRPFAGIVPRKAAFDLRGITSLPVAEWKNFISNDFERPVFAQHPELARSKQELYDAGALFASMSGSGSAVFGIFRKGGKMEDERGFYFK